MKWFYIAAILIAGLLAAMPMFYLPASVTQPYRGLVVDYRPDGEPIRKDDPVVRYDSLRSSVRSLDAATCGDTTSAAMQANFYEGPYTYHYLKRDPLVVIPQLAEALPTISEDRRVYTIPLKRGVYFHRNRCFGPQRDGRYPTREVTAEDFVLAIKRIADYHVSTGLAWAFLSHRIEGIDAYREKTRAYKAGDFRRYDLEISGVEAVDAHTLRITLEEPFPQLLYVLAMHNYAPIPREAVDYWLAGQGREDGPIETSQRRTEFREAEEVVGTGPYVLDTFERKRRIVLVRNPDFRLQRYPEDGAPGDREAGLLEDAGKPVPFIDVLQYEYVAESYSAWMRFLSRQTDLAGIPSEAFEQVITPGKELAESWRNRNIYLRTAWSPAVYWIAFNMEDPVLAASPALRQAMCLSFDVQTYIDVLYNGRGRPARNVVPSILPVNEIAGPGPYWRLDLDAAREKLATARGQLAAAGLLDEDGEIPELELDLASGGRAEQVFEYVRQQFGRVGIRVEADYSDWPTLQEKVHNKQVQMYMMGWHADYPDALNFLQLFYTPNIKKGTNNTNYSNGRFDELFERARTLPAGPERTQLYVEMIRLVAEDCPVLMLSEPLGYVLIYDWLQNVKPHPVGYGYARFQRLDAELRRRQGGRP
jgi:ABC-type transport system substrate-binding protein